MKIGEGESQGKEPCVGERPPCKDRGGGGLAKGMRVSVW